MVYDTDILQKNDYMNYKASSRELIGKLRQIFKGALIGT